ncbi:hypothetical protein L228DRAFT_266487 [Xylona heveae TC161]|uniref:DUF8004 domain-containing protein n=1 Tax=Xylona heveae (strain CBS 132557 / TC161) TaxID=1328760 RepID=A0A165HZ67_XYLHT|nr:hypothetical protein L228DRAFT_266487 [Xylona heveae TC161]KZF24124.1 hypothetical protein L228DRAFT_266487 [Xylona heveae TC161]
METVTMPPAGDAVGSASVSAPSDQGIDPSTSGASEDCEQLTKCHNPPMTRRSCSDSGPDFPQTHLLSPPPSTSALSLPGSRSSSRSSVYSSGGELSPAVPRSSVSRRPTSFYGGSFQDTLSPVPQDHPGNRKLSKRRSWLPGLQNFSSGGKKRDSSEEKYTTWILGPGSDVEFDASPLKKAKPIPELWDPDGDTFVYLFPRETGKAPSFKVDSSIFSSSRALSALAHDRVYGQDEPSPETSDQYPKISSQECALPSPTSSPVTSPTSGSSHSTRLSRASSNFSMGPRKEIHLYLAEVALKNDHNQAKVFSSSEDLDDLVSLRNLFAFLLGQALVATSKHQTILAIFLRGGGLLESFGFSNLDGSSFGEVPVERFDRYVEEFGLADVRRSPEKTIEGLILAERMRSLKLYNECFVHAVGNFDSLMKLNGPQYGLISETTRKRIERASMDLTGRLENVRLKLKEFEFPSLWAGIASSNTVDESKNIHFKAWRASFLSTRKHFLGHLKKRYGSWPPKASSKKNEFEESGLNRIVLQEVYEDLGVIYDLLVDRTSLTTRGGAWPTQTKAGGGPDSENPIFWALRGILGEYDRSSPPVLPPIPFDVPLLPSLASTRNGFGTGDAKKEAKEDNKRLKDSEVEKILSASHNADTIIKSPFLGTFQAFESKEAHRQSSNGLCDLRIGQWIFIYTVLQALPMVIVDAPGVQWKKGVEYFLCEPPKGGVPWSKEDPGLRMNWYEIAGGSGFVSLPSDIVDYSIEGTYRRSHCWGAAAKWGEDVVGLLDNAVSPTDANADADSSSPAAPAPASRLLSPNRSISPQSRLSVVNLGLEALAVPSGVSPDGTTPARPVSTFDPNLSFETIIGSADPRSNDRPRRKSRVFS